MADEQPDPARGPLSAEDRHRLRQEALRAVRLLAESLEETDEGADANSAALLARVHAAVDPLRETTSGLTVSGRSVPGTETAHAGSVTVVHFLQPDDAAHRHDARSPVVATGSGAATATVTATGSGYPVPSGTVHGTTTWTGTVTGSAPPDTFQVTAEDVPYILWQILLRLDDMDADRRALSLSEVATWVTSVISVLGTLAGLLKP